MKNNSHIGVMLLRILYAVTAAALFLYTYTQIDLSLTLSRASFVQTLQQVFQRVGYFERPVSAIMFACILFLLFGLYGYTLKAVRMKSVTRSDVWGVILGITAILVFSYPAFSYDFFNYLFTAKTVLVYHKNPYLVTPLQFTGVEPWLSFMHWTHLPTAYTPLWIVSTLLPYLFGFGYLLTLIWSLKFFLALCYLATARGIEIILLKEKPKYALFGLAVFALNPLVLIESVVSPHNDIAMMALAIWSIVLFSQNRKWLSWFVLSLSVAMKLMTVFLIPAFFYKWNRRIALAGISAGFIAVLMQREVLSWYWLWVVPFVALLPEEIYLVVLSGGISFGLLARYIPFLLYGHWNDPVGEIKFWLTVVPAGASAIIAGILYVRSRMQK